MAPAPAKTLSLNLVIDVAKYRVVFAEGDRDFVDLLLSFLVMPVGTAVRVARGKSGMGCMDALYKSVEGLDEKCFNTEACKKMLLFPANAHRSNCMGLAVSVNGTPFCNHFLCPDWEDGGGQHLFWTTVKGAKCSCGKAMTAVSIPSYTDGNPSNVGVFLKGSDKYLITDDLRVSTISTVKMEELKKLGVNDYSSLIQMTVRVGRNEALNLLKHALRSKTPLSDTFLFGRRWLKAKIGKVALEIASNMQQPSNVNEERKMTMDLVVNKSNGKFLYAQAKEDVVNFFFSFLTVPLGLLSNAYHGSSSIGCIDHLRSSAKHLTEKGQIRTDEHSYTLLKPGIAPHQSCMDQILKFAEGNHSIARSNIIMQAINPKSTSFTTDKGGSFVNGPTTFMITDNLEMKPASVSKDISAISQYNNVEVIPVTMGEMEALKLLKASLTSSTPLTTVFREKLPVVNKTSSPSAFSRNLFNTSWLKKSKN